MTSSLVSLPACLIPTQSSLHKEAGINFLKCKSNHFPFLTCFHTCQTEHWPFPVGGLGGLVLRPTSPSAASAGSVQPPASGGGLSMSGLSQSLSRGVGKEGLKILPASPLAAGLSLLLFSCQVVLGLQSPPQMTATHGLDPLHQPLPKFYLLPFLPCLSAEPPGNFPDS